MRYDQYFPGVAEDLYSVYRWLRGNDPVHHLEDLDSLRPGSERLQGALARLEHRLHRDRDAVEHSVSGDP